VLQVRDDDHVGLDPVLDDVAGVSERNRDLLQVRQRPRKAPFRVLGQGEYCVGQRRNGAIGGVRVLVGEKQFEAMKIFSA